MPQCIDDVVADLAVVFHWSPDVCYDMYIEEIMMWHEKARKRTQTEK